MAFLQKWEGIPQIHMELQVAPNRLNNIEKVKHIDQWKRIEGSEIKPNIYIQLTFNKVTKII